MTVYEIISLITEIYICGILTLEYFWGRSDMDIKNEEKKRRKYKTKPDFENLTTGEMK